MWEELQWFCCTKCHAAFSKPAGSRLNEPPPQGVWPSPFQAEIILFLFCYRQGKKNAQKATPDSNLKVSVPTVFTSLEFFKIQTSCRSFFNYKSGNIHRLYLSIGKKMSLLRQAFDWQSESNLPGFVVCYIYRSAQ